MAIIIKKLRLKKRISSIKRKPIVKYFDNVFQICVYIFSNVSCLIVSNRTSLGCGRWGNWAKNIIVFWDICDEKC